ncbi:unnamed protein product, partial [Staurois parvus]
SGVLHPPRVERKLLLQALASAGWTLIDVTRLLYTADGKRYLAVYIY